MIYQWPSPGKLNLFLYVTGRRFDNYHFLQTLFHFIDYGDSIEIFVNNTGKIRLFTTSGCIKNSSNIIFRAAKLLQNYCRINNKKIWGADIFLHKILPVGSGLGGASSNAATVLILLNHQWKCYLNKRILMYLGLMLGADVPIFIYGITSLAEGIGATLTPIFIPEKWYLIIVPPINISTAFLFKMYRLNCHYSLYCSQKELLVKSFHNDFESIIKWIFPEINIYFSYLSQYAFARVTGTGSCIFSEFENENIARQVQSYLPSWINSIVAKSINISPLHYKLSKCNIAC